MNRSVSSRNLFGGFLGGVLGILVSWYVAPMALPFGVLLGVVTGWWMEDIAQMFVRSVRSAVGILKRREQVKAFLHSRFNRYGAAAGTVARRIMVSIQYIVTLPSLLFMFPLLLIRRFRQWAKHPTGTAVLITISATVVGAAITALAFGMLWPWPETLTIGQMAVAIGMVTMFLTMFGTIINFDEGNGEYDSMRSFYARWERYSQHSPITYFVRKLLMFFASEVLIPIALALTIIYWVPLGGALIALVVIPVATFVAFMVGLYKIAQRSAHWCCLGVTLVTTGISALVFYDSFDNDVTLWTVALCTGFVSGIATEVLRQIGIWWSNTAMGQYYLDVWYDENEFLLFSIATPAWRMLMRVFSNTGERAIRLVA